jgi:Na+-driven multidrug efflux pump
MTPFVGQNFGAKRLDRVREGIRFAYRFALYYGISVALILQLLGGVITDLFGLDGDAKHAALLHMRIVPLSYIALACAMAVNGSLNALGKPMAAMWVSLSRTVAVYAPLAWVLSQLFGIIGIFIAAASANFISGGIGVFWLRLTVKELAAGLPVKPAEQRA